MKNVKPPLDFSCFWSSRCRENEAPERGFFIFHENEKWKFFHKNFAVKSTDFTVKFSWKFFHFSFSSKILPVFFIFHFSFFRSSDNVRLRAGPADKRWSLLRGRKYLNTHFGLVCWLPRSSQRHEKWKMKNEKWKMKIFSWKMKNEKRKMKNEKS